MNEFTPAVLAKALALALLFGTLAPAQATPLDKLSGQTVSVGSLRFSGFSWKQFSGIGPSNIDVQGIILIDPDTGAQQGGLRFTTTQSGVPSPLTLSPKGGAHEVAFTFSYVVTDLTAPLVAMTHSVAGAVIGPGAAQIGLGSIAIPPSDPFGFDAAHYTWDANQSQLMICIGPCITTLNGAVPGYPRIVGANNPLGPVSTPLVAGSGSYQVQTSVGLVIANGKGVQAGTAILSNFDALFSK